MKDENNNLEKLKSGSYRYRKQINGKTLRITFDHKPTENEILLALGKYLDDAPVPKETLIFSNAAKQYLEMRRNVLSPRTVKEYSELPDRLSEKFVTLNVYDITLVDVQAEINRLAEKKSPKTVKNYSSFITSVIKTFNHNFVGKVTLPQPVKNEPYIPTDEEIVRFLNYIKEERPKYYVLMVLGTYGLRRSEIMAITSEDLDGNILHITKAKVLDDDNNWVIKTTKTTDSHRAIEIPQEIADIIREEKYAFNYNPGDISKVITTACKRLGIKRFSLHKLRHYFATKLVASDVDVMTIAALGGWSSPAMIYNRYGHAIEEKKRSALTHIDSVIKGNL